LVREHLVWLVHESANFAHACQRALRPLGVRLESFHRIHELRPRLAELGAADLLVVDLGSPGARGSGFLEELRRTRGARVLLIGEQPLPTESVAPGWRQLLHPFDARTLRSSVEDLLAA